MLNFNSLIIFSDKPSALVEFYKKVLQTEVEWSGGDFSSLRAGQGFLIFGPHSKVHGKNMKPERMIFNFETPDVKGEFERIKKMGAKVIQKPYHPDEDDKDAPDALVATFADPDGNFFQLESPFPGDKKD